MLELRLQHFVPSLPENRPVAQESFHKTRYVTLHGPGFNVQRNPSCLRTAINKGYKAARFGARTADGADARREQWMPEPFFERSISITTETIFLRLKSI